MATETPKASPTFRYFEHEKCTCFPCHPKAGSEDKHNCLFCYCPLYSHPVCPGTPKVLSESGVRDCSECLWIHDRENYLAVIQALSRRAKQEYQERREAGEKRG